MARRLLPALAALLLLAGPGCKKKSEEPADEAEKKLAVGDPAPPLAVDRWLRGGPVAFEPGKVYVLDFWATWCGPCLSAMGHLDELARAYRPRGVTFVSITTADDRGNSPEAVAKFLAGRGKDLDFVFALCEKPDTADAYLAASGNTALPATFVVDGAGAVVYIGHPDDLDEVLPRVLAGTWRGAADATALKQQEAELDDILGRVKEAGEMARLSVGPRPDPRVAAAVVGRAVERAAQAAAGDLDKYAAKYPGRAAKPTFQLTRVQVLLQARRYDDARKATEPVLEQSARRRNPDLLRLIVSVWADPRQNPERRSPELPVRAADELLKIDGDASPGALLLAARAYYFAGEKVRGRAYGEKAIELTPDPRQRAALARELGEYGAE